MSNLGVTAKEIIEGENGEKREIIRILDERDLEPLSESDILEAMDSDGMVTPGVDAEPLSFEDILHIMDKDPDDNYKDASPLTQSDIIDILESDGCQCGCDDCWNPSTGSGPGEDAKPISKKELEEIMKD